MNASRIFRLIPGMRFATPLLLTLLLCGSIFAQADAPKDTTATSPRFTEEKINLIEENLLNDLESPITGVVIGGAQTTREMKKAVPTHDFSKLIISLMRIVKDDKSDRASRILAALTLDELNSERGNFAISREAEFSTDPVFKSFCASLAQVRKAGEKK